MRKDGHEDAGRENAAERCNDCTRDAGNIFTDKSSRIDGNRTGGHLRDGDKVREIRERKPSIFPDNLFLNQRHGSISAAKGKSADLKKRKEQFDIHTHDSAPL